MSRSCALALALLASTACSGQGGGNASALAAAPGPRRPAALSILEAGPGSCLWRRIAVESGSAETLAEFRHDCIGGAVAWSADGASAVVSFQPAESLEGFLSADALQAPFVARDPIRVGAIPRIYAVNLRTRETAELPAPAPGELRKVGLASDGGIMALTLELAEPSGAPGQRFFAVDGERIPAQESEGIPVLAHALRWRGGQWVREESAASSDGWDLAPGVGALRADRLLSPPTFEILSPHAAGTPVTAPELRASLAAIAPELPRQGFEWVQLRGADPPVYVAEAVPDELFYATGVLVLRVAGQLRRAPQLGFTSADLTAPQISGSWVLVSAAYSGRFPRLYDLRTGELVWSSDTARAAVFWP